MNIEQIAQVCHEANRIYCLSLGDRSHLHWEDCPQWQRDSAINGVKFKLSSDASPREMHENWMRDRAADGWTYGNIKDVDAKTHPCMVPYDELPMEQRTKDHIFSDVVRTFAELLEP